MASTDFTAIESALGYRFSDPVLLKRALTHASVAQRRRDSNERLEFLGDRVLGLIAADMLLSEHLDEDEGAIAKRHVRMVDKAALAKVAKALGLGSAITIETRAIINDTILSDAMEAVIAALYLDGGLDAARAFIVRHWGDAMQASAPDAPDVDPKSRLQEWTMARGLPLPAYDVVSRSGSDHAPVFIVSVTVQGYQPLSAEGASKRQAEKAAASALYAIITQKQGKNA